MEELLLKALKIALSCLKTGTRDPEIISDLENTIRKAELSHLEKEKTCVL